MIEYDEDWFCRLLCARKGSVFPKAFMWSLPSLMIALMCLFMDEWVPSIREGVWAVGAASQLWAALTGIIVFMIGFRTKQAFDRFWEGTGLLHQMRGEWFDTVSNCVTFSISAKGKKPVAVMNFRHAIIRIMSLCHASALEEISGNNMELESIDTFGLDDKTLNHLQECHCKYHFNKVEVMLHLLQSLITSALADGVMEIPAPIASRVYQTISRGFVNLLNAKKIQDTQFPFPYVQLIWFFMILLTVLTPSLITVILESKLMALVFTFIPMFGLWCLNFVAQELENPFGIDDNDLPLQKFQTEMNNCLMMLLHPNADLVCGVSADRCEMDFHKLRESVSLSVEESTEKEEQEQRDGDQCEDEEAEKSDTSGSQGGSDGAERAEKTKKRRPSLVGAVATRIKNRRGSTESSSSSLGSGGKGRKNIRSKTRRLSDFELHAHDASEDSQETPPPDQDPGRGSPEIEPAILWTSGCSVASETSAGGTRKSKQRTSVVNTILHRGFSTESKYSIASRMSSNAPASYGRAGSNRASSVWEIPLDAQLEARQSVGSTRQEPGASSVSAHSPSDLTDLEATPAEGGLAPLPVSETAYPWGRSQSNSRSPHTSTIRAAAIPVASTSGHRTPPESEDIDSRSEQRHVVLGMGR